MASTRERVGPMSHGKDMGPSSQASGGRDLDGAPRRAVQGIASDPSRDQVHQAYVRFLQLCVRDPDARTVPPRAVDHYWHAHLDRREAYGAFCRSTVGAIVHHEAGFGRDSPTLLALHAAMTIERYKKEFGEEPPSFWTVDEAAACSGCVRPVAA